MARRTKPVSSLGGGVAPFHEAVVVEPVNCHHVGELGVMWYLSCISTLATFMATFLLTRTSA